MPTSRPRLSESANFEALRSLIASRRPTRIWLGIERGVGARPAARRPVAHAVRAVLLEQRHRRHDVALRLRHLLAIGIEHPARDRRVRPRQRVVLEVGAQHRVEQPGADDVVRLRPQVHRERPREQIRIVRPAADDLRRQRRGRPGVHDVGIADEPARRAALIGAIARRHVGRGIDRQLILARRDRTLVLDAAEIASSGYQTGNGTPKNRCRLTHQSPFRPLVQFS